VAPPQSGQWFNKCPFVEMGQKMSQSKRNIFTDRQKAKVALEALKLRANAKKTLFLLCTAANNALRKTGLGMHQLAIDYDQ